MDIVMKDVLVRLEGRTIVQGVSGHLRPGSITALSGPSGCGKTTLLNCVGRLLPVAGGSITYDGTVHAELVGRRRRMFHKEKVGFLFQNFGLVDNLSIQDNFAVCLDRPRKADIIEALDGFHLAKPLRAPVYSLSGGEQQRVALAMLSLKKPRLILADEPTSALDRDNEDYVLAALRSFADQGSTVVISTHSPRVLDTSDQVVRL